MSDVASHGCLPAWNIHLDTQNLHELTDLDSFRHYSDAIMSAMAYLITGVSIVYSTVCPGVDQIKHQSSASLSFVMRIHQWPVNSPHKGPVTQKMFPFDNLIMNISSAGFFIHICRIFRFRLRLMIPPYWKWQYKFWHRRQDWHKNKILTSVVSQVAKFLNVLISNFPIPFFRGSIEVGCNTTIRKYLTLFWKARLDCVEN